MSEEEEMITVPSKELNDFVQKMDKVVELILTTERSIALDVALLDVRDAARALAERI